MSKNLERKMQSSGLGSLVVGDFSLNIDDLLDVEIVDVEEYEREDGTDVRAHKRRVHKGEPKSGILSTSLQRSQWNHKYKKYEGQKVDITVDGKTYKGRTLYFAGTNAFGRSVISTTGAVRDMYEVKDWDSVVIIGETRSDYVFKSPIVLTKVVDRVDSLNKEIKKVFPDIKLIRHKRHGYFQVASDNEEINEALAGLYTTTIGVNSASDQDLGSWMDDISAVLNDEERHESERQPVYPDKEIWVPSSLQRFQVLSFDSTGLEPLKTEDWEKVDKIMNKKWEEFGGAVERNPKFKKDISLEEFEDIINNNIHETMGIFKDGELVTTVNAQGDNRSQIAPNFKECARMQGAVVTHNHPDWQMYKDGRSFGLSASDISASLYHGAKEIRAVAGDVVYSLIYDDIEIEFPYIEDGEEYTIKFNKLMSAHLGFDKYGFPAATLTWEDSAEAFKAAFMQVAHEVYKETNPNDKNIYNETMKRLAARSKGLKYRVIKINKDEEEKV